MEFKYRIEDTFTVTLSESVTATPNGRAIILTSTGRPRTITIPLADYRWIVGYMASLVVPSAPRLETKEEPIGIFSIRQFESMALEKEIDKYIYKYNQRQIIIREAKVRIASRMISKVFAPWWRAHKKDLKEKDPMYVKAADRYIGRFGGLSQDWLSPNIEPGIPYLAHKNCAMYLMACNYSGLQLPLTARADIMKFVDIEMPYRVDRHIAIQAILCAYAREIEDYIDWMSDAYA